MPKPEMWDELWGISANCPHWYRALHVGTCCWHRCTCATGNNAAIWKLVSFSASLLFSNSVLPLPAPIQGMIPKSAIDPPRASSPLSLEALAPRCILLDPPLSGQRTQASWHCPLFSSWPGWCLWANHAQSGLLALPGRSEVAGKGTGFLAVIRGKESAWWNAKQQ